MEKQIQRLEKIGKSLKFNLDGLTCQAMKGLIAESQETMAENAAGEVIATVQRIEHCEISGYGTAAHFAKRQPLDGEQLTHTRLNDLAKNYINQKAT
jgi:ferritin-like metal-binding protein YciE